MDPSNQDEDGSLRDWILKEIISGREENNSIIAKVLHEYKEDFKHLLEINEDGK